MKIYYKLFAVLLVTGLVFTGCATGPSPAPQKGPSPIYDENGNIIWQPLPDRTQTQTQPGAQPGTQSDTQTDTPADSQGEPADSIETKSGFPQDTDRPEPAPQIGSQDQEETGTDDSHLIAAVTPLADQAEQQMEMGQLDRAFATAERAVRIDPYNAKLWNLMARIRFKQENYSQAQQLAKKSNLLARENERALKSLNWKIIAAVLSQEGHEEQAREALLKAQEYE